MVEVMESARSISIATRPDRQTRRAVYGAVVSAVRANGIANLDIELIAKQALVEGADIRAWWPTDSELIIESFRSLFAADLAYPATGDFAADLAAQLSAIARIFTDSEVGPHLAALLGRAQTEPVIAEQFRSLVYEPNRAAARQRFAKAQEEGALRRGIDVDAAIDLTFAPLWFALLVRGEPITAEYVDAIVDLCCTGIGTERLLRELRGDAARERCQEGNSEIR
jgi:Tetracyclin repressor-like, C-terminal domain